MILQSSAEERFQRLLSERNLYGRYTNTNANPTTIASGSTRLKLHIMNHQLSPCLYYLQRKSQSGLEPTADGHPIIHLRFFSSETGVGIGSKTTALRLILRSFSCFLNQNETENSLPLIKKFLSPPTRTPTWKWKRA